MSALPEAPADRVLALLPVHVRARDEGSGGLLRALAEAVGAELDLLERDVDELYASWFVETCPEWVVPYLADLVGVPDLPPDLSRTGGALTGGAAVSRRAFVANTVAYRRRKGTVAVLEQVARDVTGWPARAVEYFGLLAASTHVNHVRLDRPATAAICTPVREGAPLELVPAAVAQGALDRTAHTAEVRRIASGRGRYGIANVGVFLFPDQVYESGWAPARPPTAPGEGWSVHPLGWATPLYAPPAAEEEIEHLATEEDLPVPLRPRRLLALLAAARRAGGASDRLPVAVRVDGADLDARRTRVCALEGLATDAGGAVVAGWQVMVDAVSGRVHAYRDGVAADPSAVEVRHGYGGSADVGAGTYDRTGVHSEVLADDPYRGDPGRGDQGVTAQVAVLADDPDGLAKTSVAQALAEAEAAWSSAASPAGATYVVAIGDSASYAGDLAVDVPAATRLVVVAAAWRARVLGPGEVLPLGFYSPQGLRPHVRGSLRITGGGGGSVVLDGLVVEGDVVVEPGELGSLTISQCTVAGSIRIGVGAASNPAVAVRVVRAVTGPVLFGPAAATLAVHDSVVDAALGPGAAGVAVHGDGLHLEAEGSTIRGRTATRTLAASSAIFDGPVRVEHRQTGCVRYSFVDPDARVPRRFRCVPTPGGDLRTRPSYATVDPGAPHYLALARGCPPTIAEGGEGGSEMGVHHHLARPLRIRAAGRLLDPYLPAGLELGVAAPVATGRN